MLDSEKTQNNHGEVMSGSPIAVMPIQGTNSSAKTYCYSASISQIPQCPPANAKECDKDGWRFTLSPHTLNCFWPPARRNPQRVAKTVSASCSMWALSMYETDSQAMLAYSMLKKTVKNIKKAVGDHLSQGSITVNDGKCTPPSHNGHYDFHPYINSNFTSSFVVIRKLP
nr:hypothetical protein [Pantoea agglomerans]